MAKNYALVIGINSYTNLRPLMYAGRDAEAMQDFLLNEANFDEIYFFSNNSPPLDTPPGQPVSTQPTFATLKRFLRKRFEQPFMSPGDNFWLFFSGHGVRYDDRDYLLLSDSDPECIEETAIPVSYLSEQISRCGADNVLLVFDATRGQGSRGSPGIGERSESRDSFSSVSPSAKVAPKTQSDFQQGLITIFSCSPYELSYEIESLQHGAFTYALLEGLRLQGERNCATVERLSNYLSYRVPELNRQYDKPRQTPYVIAEPLSKVHLILLPKYATLSDIATLTNDAYQAELEQDYKLAEQLWIRILASSPADMEAVRTLQRLAIASQKQNDFPRSDVFPIIENSQKKKILILASNPRDTSRLRLDAEFREIADGLQRSRNRDKFTLAQRWAVRAKDVRRAMLEFDPQIVHFSGHGSADIGLVLENESGNPQAIRAEALASLFKLFANRVECVVLNACYSEAQAEAIAQHIDYVVGISPEMGEGAAIEFTVSFYDALGAGESIEFAYKLGRNAIQLAGVPAASVPVLRSKPERKVFSQFFETAKHFLKQAGALAIPLGEDKLQITSAVGSLKAYTPIPVVMTGSEPTDRDVLKVLEYAKQLDNMRQSHVGILLYRELPDALFRIRMAEMRMREHFVLIPISLSAIEQALLNDFACAGLLAEYIDRYLGADLFDDRNAIGDTLSFFGRSKILNRLEEGLKKHQGIGLFGLRKSGKTSLLLQVGFALREHPVLHIDLQPYGGKLYYGIEIFNQILSQLSKLSISESFQPFEPNVAAANITSVFIGKVTEMALILQEKGYELPLICLLDEIERILPSKADPREKIEEFNAVFGSLRALSQEKRLLGLLVADVHPDCNRINHWSQPDVPTNPVFSFFREEFVSPFSPDETRMMLTDIGKLMGRGFDDETLALIHRDSGGHPFIARQLASLLCNRVTSESNGLINYSASKVYLDKPFTYSSILKDYVGQSIWGDLKKRGFEAAIAVLNLLACNEESGQETSSQTSLGIFLGVFSILVSPLSKVISKHEPFGIAEQVILEQLGVRHFSESQCLDALLWLESVGLITRHQPARQNHYSFRIFFLSRWLRMQMTKKEVEQWRIN